ncbi:hypothetical protein [Rheinheimera aquimaris]|jgi:hypothetical protein|uniref:hypothetical protein n=1 Tax=Rheinheimera aquimaris TaxID=412437 RepID=UPI001066CA7E|nr:hypothetical protein [Rheinheimera aquimaris]
MFCLSFHDRRIHAVKLTRQACAFVFALTLTRCAGMDVQEVYYVAVPSGDNTNYYRVRVQASAKLGDANYDAAWFSAHSVDALYGDVSTSNAAESLNVENAMRSALNEELEKAYKAYLTVAASPTATNAELATWMQVLKRLRAMPGSMTPLPTGAIEIEYNPVENLITRRAGQKLVMVMSSDPTQVINGIKGFSQSTETSASVLKLTDVLQQQQKNLSDKEQAEIASATDNFTLIARQLNLALESAATAEQDELLRRVISLLTVAESLQ